jgi:O-antigen/teichoic acid export membrane protein
MLTTLVVRGGGAFSLFVLTVYLARTLGAAGAGEFLWAINLLLGLSLFARLGLDVTMLRFSSPAWESRDLAGLRGLARQTVASVALASLTLIAAGALFVFTLGDRLLPGEAYRALFWMVLAALLPYTLLYPAAAFLKGMRMPELGAFAERAGLPVIALGLAALLFQFQPPNSTLALAAYAAAAALMLLGLAAVIFLKTRGAGAPRETAWRQIRQSCMPAMVMGLAIFAVNWWCAIALAWHVPPDEVGVYNAAQRVANVASFVLQAFVSVYAPRFPGLWARGEREALGRVVKKGTRVMLLAAAPLVLMALVFPEALLGLFGREFESGGMLLRILIAGQVVSVGTGCVAYLLMMTGHEREMRNIVLGVSIFVVAGGWVAILFWGALGAAVTTTAGVAAQNLFAARMVRRKLDISSLPW